MKKARIVYNPSSGKETIRKNLAFILEELEAMGYETSTYATKGAGDAEKEAKRVAKEEFELLIAAGGDGTLYEVINGIAGEEKRPKVAIIPTGTSNDFAKALKIPKDIKKNLEVIKKQKTEFVDVGKMNERYFINIAGGGTLTELTYEVPSKLKTVLGQAAYYLKGIEKIAQLKPYKVKIKANGETYNEEVLVFLVANTNVVGSHEKMAPLASYNDGFFDVLILRKANIAELTKVLTSFPKGDHIYDPNVLHFRTDKLEILTDEYIQINLDGELGGNSPCRFSMLKKHIEFISNNTN